MLHVQRPIALAALLTLVGCATPPERPPATWRVQPVWRVDQAPQREAGPGYAALGRKYDGEGRWREAADAYRKAALADPANAEYRQALELALSHLDQPARAAPAAEAPRPALVLLTAPTVSALTVVSAVESPVAEASGHDVPNSEVVRNRAPVVLDVALPTARPAPARVEIVNGNGVRGAAARMRERLGDAAGNGVRLSNRAPYRVQSTLIEYRPGYADQALAIAWRMPVRTQLMASSSLGARIDVRVLLGRDLNGVSSAEAAAPSSAS